MGLPNFVLGIGIMIISLVFESAFIVGLLFFLAGLIMMVTPLIYIFVKSEAELKTEFEDMDNE